MSAFKAVVQMAVDHFLLNSCLMPNHVSVVVGEKEVIAARAMDRVKVAEMPCDRHGLSAYHSRDQTV